MTDINTDVIVVSNSPNEVWLAGRNLKMEQDVQMRVWPERESKRERKKEKGRKTDWQKDLSGEREDVRDRVREKQT